MKKLTFLLLIIFVSGCTSGKAVQQESLLQDSGSIEVYFCPEQECEEKLLSFLDSAQDSIHCALFDIGLASVQKKLDEKEKKIEVLIITDNDYVKKFNHHFVKADTYGLMHNKFCVIDGKKVITGSMNPTDNDANKNNNNVLFIDSRIIAQNYEDEFQELFAGTFKKGEPVKEPKINLSGMRMENYFCPDDRCAEQVKEELKKAERSIYFMTFSFTHEGIANILLLKNLDGITVSGVMEARQISEYSQFNRLLQNGIDVRKDGNKNNMHHKVFIIDEKTVVTGSFNPTNNGDKNNDENVVIIEDPAIADLFVVEFWKVYGEAGS
ncbi:MAG: phospholipase D-like domain-containing protein [Nanoarchaeota archaeon]